MFLPMTRKECQQRGWNEIDFLLISGDAYVDHPSFAAAVIGRVLEAEGYRVAIAAQPKSAGDLNMCGTPLLGILISAGNMDSMVMNYTANKKRRRDDAYSPGGRNTSRPDRATIFYTSMARQQFKGIPVIIGGVEASLRRLAHYDYWSDKLRRSLLLDSKADLLVYGMGEKPVVEIADRLARGEELHGILGTCEVSKDPEGILLPAWEDLDKERFVESFKIQLQNNDPHYAKALSEPYGGRFLVQHPPADALSREDLDRIYELPFERAAHWSYKEPIPALAEVQNSITSNRGCFGGCSFCAITFHQGRSISSRSKQSILKEAEQIAAQPGFKGNIHDVGGPTANFQRNACSKMTKHGPCKDKNCLGTDACPNLQADHSEYLDILDSLRKMDRVKKVFIRSGIRYDYLIRDKKKDFFKSLVKHHVSGQLRVAPEHVVPKVLKLMGKPAIEEFETIKNMFEQESKKIGKKQFMVPYYISSHPGSDLKAAIELALYVKKSGFIPDQVQDFYPTPGTVSSCMYFTGIDPRTGEKVYVAKSQEERMMQRALLHFHKKENQPLVIKALKKAGRSDLIRHFYPQGTSSPKPQRGKSKQRKY
jgi:uncharacterized radical SAM protein YgiQ